MNIMTVVEKVGVLSIIMAFGFLVVKTGFVDAKIKDSISKLIVSLILPCLIISSISRENFKPEIAGELLLVVLLSLFCIITLFGVGVLTAKLLKIPDSTKTVHELLLALGNVIFIGYPIVVAVYGDKGGFYTIIYWLFNDMFLWTVGVFLFAKNMAGKNNFLKKFLNINTISFVVAILMFLFRIKLPPLLDSAMSGVGGLTTNLSMIFIGMSLATVDVRKIMEKWWVIVIAPLKLLIMPIVFMFVFKYLGIDETILGVVVLEAAMPAQIVLAIVANEHKADSDYSAVCMFVTTILSLITLPFICYLLNIYV